MKNFWGDVRAPNYVTLEYFSGIFRGKVADKHTAHGGVLGCFGRSHMTTSQQFPALPNLGHP